MPTPDSVIEEHARDFTIRRLWEASDQNALVPRLAPGLRFAAAIEPTHSTPDLGTMARDVD